MYSTIQFLNINGSRIKSSAHLAVVSRETNPNNIDILLDQDRYWVDGVGQNEWVGQDYNIAIYKNGTWVFEETRIGSLAFVEDENVYCYFNGSTIQEYGTTAGKHASTHEPGGSDQLTKFDAGLF